MTRTPSRPREEPPLVAGHARRRWLGRSSVPTLEISLAWLDAVPIPAEEFDVEEARYHPGAEVVMLRRGDVIVTALAEDVSEPVARSAVESASGRGSA